MTMPSDTGSESETFWENHYARLDARWGTTPNDLLVDLVTAHETTPGTALDLGCGHGGDALWLAARGWQVTAVDVSATALARVDAAASAAGLAGRVRTSRHDVTQTFPDGTFDLVSACYFHTPLEIPREQVLRRAARAVAPDGLLIVVEHGSVAPWSWQAGQDVRFPTPDQVLASLDLDQGWEALRCDAPERAATGPQGQRATVTDIAVVARRRGTPARS